MTEVHLAMLAGEAREAIDSEDYVRAAGACHAALQRFPRWVEGYWLLGKVLVENGNVTKARDCFEAVASASPDDPRAYEGLAAIAENQKDAFGTVAALERALEVGETSQGVMDLARQLRVQLGQPPTLAPTQAKEAHALLLIDKFGEAESAAQRGLEQESTRLDLLLVRAVAELCEGKRDDALATCRRLLELSPDCLKALAIVSYLDTGEHGAAARHDLDELDPEGHTFVWLRGRLTSLGYEADDLPSAVRVIAWSDDQASDADGDNDQLGRLLPELSAVWPRWLDDAARSTEPAPVPVTEEVERRAEQGADAKSSSGTFLGDIETLARDFERAWQQLNAVNTPEEKAAPTVGERAADGAGADAAPTASTPEPTAGESDVHGESAGPDQRTTYPALQPLMPPATAEQITAIQDQDVASAEATSEIPSPPALVTLEEITAWAREEQAAGRYWTAVTGYAKALTLVAAGRTGAE